MGIVARRVLFFVPSLFIFAGRDDGESCAPSDFRFAGAMVRVGVVGGWMARGDVGAIKGWEKARCMSASNSACGGYGVRDLVRFGMSAWCRRHFGELMKVPIKARQNSTERGVISRVAGWWRGVGGASGEGGGRARPARERRIRMCQKHRPPPQGGNGVMRRRCARLKSSSLAGGGVWVSVRRDGVRRVV